jgi:hypothetical protein
MDIFHANLLLLSSMCDFKWKQVYYLMEVDLVSEQEKIRLTSLSTKAG